MSVQGPRLVVDIRALTPALRRPLVLSIVDHLLGAMSTETIVVITDHEPAGLGYQMELRRETRGRVGFSYDQRLDGAAHNQIVRRDIGAPILAAEGRLGIEEILPVLQIQHRAGGGAGLVSGGKIDDDIARRGEVARGETGMQTDSPLVFGSIL